MWAAQRHCRDQQRKMTLALASCRRRVETEEVQARAAPSPLVAELEEAQLQFHKIQDKMRQQATKQKVNDAFKVPVFQQRRTTVNEKNREWHELAALLRRCDALRAQEAKQQQSLREVQEQREALAAELSEQKRQVALAGRAAEKDLSEPCARDLRARRLGAREAAEAHRAVREDRFMSIAREKCKWADSKSIVLLSTPTGLKEIPLRKTVKDLDDLYKSTDGVIYAKVQRKAAAVAPATVKAAEEEVSQPSSEDGAAQPVHHKMNCAVNASKDIPVEKDSVLAKTRKIALKHPDRVPVLINQAETQGLPRIDKKLLVPRTMTVAELRKILPKHLKLESEIDKEQWNKVQMLMAGEEVKDDEKMSAIYETYVVHDDEDGLQMTLEMPVPSFDFKDMETEKEPASLDLVSMDLEQLHGLEERLLAVKEELDQANRDIQEAKLKTLEEEARADRAEEREMSAKLQIADLQEQKANVEQQSEKALQDQRLRNEMTAHQAERLQELLEELQAENLQLANAVNGFQELKAQNEQLAATVKDLQAALDTCLQSGEEQVRKAQQERREEAQLQRKLQEKLLATEQSLHKSKEDQMALLKSQERDEASILKLKEMVLELKAQVQKAKAEERTTSLEEQNKMLQNDMEALKEENLRLKQQLAETAQAEPKARTGSEDEGFVKLSWNSDGTVVEDAENSPDFELVAT
ncbi:unnamed protein product [Effrenium voratum]|nr:unnamed protein product [Effrenium voratum]